MVSRGGDRRAGNASTGVLYQMVTQNHDQSEEGHKRLRNDLRDLEKQVDALDASTSALAVRVLKLEQAPVNVDKVAFSGRQLIAIVSACVVLAAGMWRLQVAIDLVGTAVTNAAKLQDERNDTIKEELKQQKAALEMRRVEIQNLSNLVQQRLGGR